VRDRLRVVKNNKQRKKANGVWKEAMMVNEISSCRFLMNEMPDAKNPLRNKVQSGVQEVAYSRAYSTATDETEFQ
jgi:hypothetical protein